jgi:hypothetical protein
MRRSARRQFSKESSLRVSTLACREIVDRAAPTSARSGLILLLFLHFGPDGGFGGLKAGTAMSAITKRLIYRTAATAEREIRLSGQIILLAVCVNEFDGAFGSLHAERTVFSRHDFDLCHVSSGGVIDFDSVSFVHLQKQIPRCARQAQNAKARDYKPKFRVQPSIRV